MLKKKVNGSWSDTSMLKKQDNGVWSYISNLKKKINGAWIDVFFNWFSIIKYQITGNCVGQVKTHSSGSSEIYNHLESSYGTSSTVSAAFGKFNAVAGDTITIEYSYEIYVSNTGGSRAEASIRYNLSPNSQGSIIQTLFNATNIYSLTWDSDTVSYTFTQNYNDVGIYVEAYNWYAVTAFGETTTTVYFPNVYLNGAKIYCDEIAYYQ